MKHSPDYQDYVFKDGKFLGKFDDMYRYSTDPPWHQDKTAYQIFSDIDITILKQYKYSSVCEIGCGLGYFAERLRKDLIFKKGTKAKVTGIDVSDAAIKKAKKLFPKVNFIKGNLLLERPLGRKTFGLVITKEVLWYVVYKLPKFLSTVVDMVKDNGLLYVSQSFPESKKWFGQKIISSPEKLKIILSQYAEPIYYCVEYDWNYNGRPLIHFLGRITKG